MEKAAMRAVAKKEEASVSEEQAREAALKKEAVYGKKIAAWKIANQVRADVNEAHVKPSNVEATGKAADVEAARRREAIVEPPLISDDNAGGGDIEEDEN